MNRGNYSSLQSLSPPLGAVLRRADEHLDKIIVQGIVELPLEAPLELRIVQVARVQVEIVRVNRDGRVLELNDDLNPFAFGPRREIQQRMLIQAQLRQDAFEARIGRAKHYTIVM